jgi:hypothetical protein
MTLDITYSKGPRILRDGTNLDEDIDASFPTQLELSIDHPVSGIGGLGYEPGQKNLDNSDL